MLPLGFGKGFSKLGASGENSVSREAFQFGTHPASFSLSYLDSLSGATGVNTSARSTSEERNADVWGKPYLADGTEILTDITGYFVNGTTANRQIKVALYTARTLTLAGPTSYPGRYEPDVLVQEVIFDFTNSERGIKIKSFTSPIKMVAGTVYMLVYIGDTFQTMCLSVREDPTDPTKNSSLNGGTLSANNLTAFTLPSTFPNYPSGDMGFSKNLLFVLAAEGTREYINTGPEFQLTGKVLHNVIGNDDTLSRIYCRRTATGRAGGRLVWIAYNNLGLGGTEIVNPGNESDPTTGIFKHADFVYDIAELKRYWRTIDKDSANTVRHLIELNVYKKLRSVDYTGESATPFAVGEVVTQNVNASNIATGTVISNTPSGGGSGTLVLDMAAAGSKGKFTINASVGLIGSIAATAVCATNDPYFSQIWVNTGANPDIKANWTYAMTVGEQPGATIPTTTVSGIYHPERRTLTKNNLAAVSFDNNTSPAAPNGYIFTEYAAGGESTRLPLYVRYSLDAGVTWGWMWEINSPTTQRIDHVHSCYQDPRTGKFIFIFGDAPSAGGSEGPGIVTGPAAYNNALEYSNLGAATAVQIEAEPGFTTTQVDWPNEQMFRTIELGFDDKYAYGFTDGSQDGSVEMGIRKYTEDFKQQEILYKGVNGVDFQVNFTQGGGALKLVNSGARNGHMIFTEFNLESKSIDNKFTFHYFDGVRFSSPAYIEMKDTTGGSIWSAFDIYEINDAGTTRILLGGTYANRTVNNVKSWEFENYVITLGSDFTGPPRKLG